MEQFRLSPKMRMLCHELRSNMPNAEKALWKLFRNRQFMNLKFRRQYPIGRYILDFYCCEYKLEQFRYGYSQTVKVVGAFLKNAPTSGFGQTQPGIALAIELDGGQHASPENEQYDQTRTEYLTSQGIKVIRFWNNEVLANPESVLETIITQIPTEQLTEPNRFKVEKT